MANIINAITSGAGGLSTTADSSGIINLQSGGTTVAAVSSTGVAVTGTLTVGGTSAIAVAPGTNGNILTSNGTTWTSAAPASSGNPAGTIIQFAATSAPTGYLLCPTSLTNISRTTYSALFAVIGTTWGAGDGSTTFGLPWFAANYAAVQASANVGTATTGAVIAHSHSVDTLASGSLGYSFDNQGIGNGTVSTSSTGGAANLAAGARVLFCIKY